MRRSPAEMSYSELRVQAKRLSGLTPPGEKASRADWARWSAAFAVAIALKHFGERDRAIEWARSKLAEAPDGGAAVAIIDQVAAGAQQQVAGGDKALLENLLG